MTKLHEAAAAPGRKIVTVRRTFYLSRRGLLYASFLPILLVPNLHKEESDPDLQQPQFKTRKQSRKPTKRPKTKQRKEKETQDRHPNNKEVAKKSTGTKKAPDPERKSCNLSPTFTSILDAHECQQKRKERKEEPPPETLIAQLQSLLSREPSQSNNKHTSSNEIQKLWAQQTTTTTTTTTTKNKTANQSKRLTPEAKDQWKNT
jgi:hypothetical protein